MGTLVRQLNAPFARATGASIAIQLGAVGLAFGQALLAARLLGAAGYGSVAWAMSVVSVIATVCLLGFGPLAVREIAARRAAGDTAGLSSFVAVSVAVVGLLSIAAAAGFVWFAGRASWIAGDYREVLALCGLLIPPLAIIALLRGVAQGFGRALLAQVPGDLVRPGILIAAMTAAFVTGTAFGPVPFIRTAIAGTWIAALLLGYLLWRDELSALPAPERGARARSHLVAALPFLGLGLTGLLEAEASTLMLGWLAGPFETGIFQPVVRIAPLIMLPVQAALMQFAPLVAGHWQRGEIGQIHALTVKFTILTVLVTAGVALAIALAGPLLLGVFGSDFAQGAHLLWFIAAAQVFNAACGPVGTLLIMSDRSGWTLAGQLLGLAVNVAVGLALIPAFGALGAALGMAGGIAAWNLALVVAVRRRFGFDPTLLGAVAALGRRSP
ncbi:oligosaccharide flippase family protein [Tsuneonella sp. YG55]|uniref:Oligosaccharide flippase family protein n=1 Tax=Tsuneonella litorea TaxID=2976475 RepID=A0A9X2VYQ9_9SPHN|nr:oligosaccharide flippase family protein [Tsuneonella litorea]MCT2557810.1 oligosaccharide flippase family protein [Tsuneonella litorea]